MGAITITRTAKASEVKDYEILESAIFDTWPEAFAWLKKHQVKLSEEGKKLIESHKSAQLWCAS